MKWLCIPVILFPYSVLGMLYCLFSGTLMESVFQSNGFLCILALLAWALIGFACAFLVGIRGARTLDCLRCARFAMILKLAQIPRLLYHFCAGSPVFPDYFYHRFHHCTGFL